RVCGRLVMAVGLEYARVVDGLRGVWDEQRENHCRDEGQHQRTAYVPDPGRPSGSCHSVLPASSEFFPVVGATSASAEPTPFGHVRAAMGRPTSCVPGWEWSSSGRRQSMTKNRTTTAPKP